MSASLAMQTLVATALADLPGVSGVYDGPPPDAVPPYVVIGSDLVTDWSTKTETGHEHRLAINVWDAGPGTAAAKRLMGGVAGCVAAEPVMPGSISLTLRSAKTAKSIVSTCFSTAGLSGRRT